MMSVAFRANNISRRAFLGASVGAGVSVALAACGVPGSAQASGRTAASGTAPASASKLAGKLIVASTTAAGSQTPLWMADYLKAWENRGLAVERKRLAPDIGTKALINKDIDVLIQSASAVIPANANGNVDLVYVGSIFNFSQFALAAKASVRTAAELKGKTIGSDRPGTTTDFQTRVLLTKLGVKPDEVQMPSMGSSDAVFAALLSGKVDAGSIAVPQLFQAEAAGFRLLANTFDIKYQNIGPVVMRSRIPELSSALAVLLQGIRQGIQGFNAQPEVAMKLIEENTKESDRTILQNTYDFYTKDTHFQEDLEPTVEGIQSMIDFLADTVLPSVKSARAEQFVDRRILDQLPRSSAR
jgi:ABC-type nitrate/sulfonate/bicarbonate transport system substrate-binding protein